MKNTTAQQFEKDQVAILNLPPVDRKRSLLSLAEKYGLKQGTTHYPGNSVRICKGKVQFPYLNVQLEGYPPRGNANIYTNGGVHMRKLDKNKLCIQIGCGIDVTTLEGWLDNKFGVELQTIQARDEDQLEDPAIIVSFPVPQKYRVSGVATKWDYLHVLSPNSENLRGTVRQSLRRKLRKNEDAIVKQYFAELLA